jgi:hypothetical protein
MVQSGPGREPGCIVTSCTGCAVPLLLIETAAVPAATFIRAGCQHFFMATESTEEHGKKYRLLRHFFPRNDELIRGSLERCSCSSVDSVDSVAMISFINIGLKYHRFGLAMDGAL